MTTKLTYWERSPPGVYPISKELHTVCHTGIQDSKGHNCSRNLTRHDALLQVSHTLKRLTPTAPPQVNLAYKAKVQDQDPGTTQHRGQFKPKLKTTRSNNDVRNGCVINVADMNIVIVRDT